jgi:hypothetical protein
MPSGDHGETFEVTEMQWDDMDDGTDSLDGYRQPGHVTRW